MLEPDTCEEWLSLYFYIVFVHLENRASISDADSGYLRHRVKLTLAELRREEGISFERVVVQTLLKSSGPEALVWSHYLHESCVPTDPATGKKKTQTTTEIAPMRLFILMSRYVRINHLAIKQDTIFWKMNLTVHRMLGETHQISVPSAEKLNQGLVAMAEPAW